MSSSERREREREELRRLILDTTLELLASDGYEKLSMRRIAEQINYSATALYLHFKDKGELMDALAAEGFTLLADTVEAVQADEPVERLRRIGDAYVAFARAHPALYGLMFQAGSSPQKVYKGNNVHRIASERAFRLLTNAVREVEGRPEEDALTNDVFTEPDPAAFAAVLLWAHIHGAVSLILSGRNRRFAGLEPQFCRKAVDTAIAGLLAELKR